MATILCLYFHGVTTFDIDSLLGRKEFPHYMTSVTTCTHRGFLSCF